MAVNGVKKPIKKYEIKSKIKLKASRLSARVAISIFGRSTNELVPVIYGQDQRWTALFFQVDAHVQHHRLPRIRSGDVHAFFVLSGNLDLD